MRYRRGAVYATGSHLCLATAAASVAPAHVVRPCVRWTKIGPRNRKANPGPGSEGYAIGRYIIPCDQDALYQTNSRPNFLGQFGYVYNLDQCRTLAAVLFGGLR